MIDHRNPEPLFLQLARILRDKINNGEITDVLPSNRSLRETYDVGETVVTNAINVLTDEGLVFSIPRRGIYVKRQNQS